jgi:hypothetical protein
MRLLRLSLVSLVGLGLTLGVLSCQRRASSDEGRGERARLVKVPALQLPRTLAVLGGSREFVWAEGVAEAARMYFPSEMPVYRVVRQSPEETARAVVSRLGGAMEDSAARDPESQDEHTCFARVGEAGISAYPDGNYSLRLQGRHPNRAAPRSEAEAPGIPETIGIVGALLEQYPGLLPEGARQVEVVPIGTSASPDPKTGRERVVVRNRGVVYRRFHNGFPEGRFTVMVNLRGRCGQCPATCGA